MQSKTLIVLLNWNGTSDTLECVSSLSQCSDGDFDVLVIDNNSIDEHYVKLKNGLRDIGLIPLEVDFPSKQRTAFKCNERICYKGTDSKYFLIRAEENYGFAKACNEGALFAADLGYTYILLLNNDTIVTSGFHRTLRETLVSKESIKAVIPQIRLYSDKKIIWNCGGTINKLGNRKYYFSYKNATEVDVGVKEFNVTFATGCCIIFETNYFINIGMFTEDFFFGEEDIEFSLRMKKLKAVMVCNPNAIIYHKVGASITGDTKKIAKKAYIHYLNRFINMKTYMGCFWWLWLIPSLMKVFFNIIIINKLDVTQALYFIGKLYSDARHLNGVSKDKFETILNSDYLK